MIVRDNVSTTEPTHVLVKHNGKPVVALEVNYPEGSIIDEIDGDWILDADAGWFTDYETGDQSGHRWAITLFMMDGPFDRDTCVCVATDALYLPEFPPMPDADVAAHGDETWDTNVVSLEDINRTQYETMFALAGIPLLILNIDEGGVEEICFPREDLRTPEQDAESARNVAYLEALTAKWRQS